MIEFPLTAKKTYLWLHDPCYHPAYRGEILPFNGKYLVENVIDKIDRIVVLSDFHKDRISQLYGVHSEKMRIIGNAINHSCYENFETWKQIEKVKVPYRFIYTSDACRGLEELVDYFETIHQEFPEAELFVYRDEKSFENYTELLKKIQNSSHMHYEGKVDQTQLALEFCKSDVWLYPLKTTEMFCMSALEALRGGCYCICNPRAALTQVIGEHGVLVEGEPGSQKIKENFLNEVRKVFNDSELKKRIQEKAFDYAKTQTWEYISNQWLEMMK